MTNSEHTGSLLRWIFVRGFGPVVYSWGLGGERNGGATTTHIDSLLPHPSAPGPHGGSNCHFQPNQPGHEIQRAQMSDMENPDVAQRCPELPEELLLMKPNRGIMHLLVPVCSGQTEGSIVEVLQIIVHVASADWRYHQHTTWQHRGADSSVLDAKYAQLTIGRRPPLGRGGVLGGARMGGGGAGVREGWLVGGGGPGGAMWGGRSGT